jgi:hypothetical protein
MDILQITGSDEHDVAFGIHRLRGPFASGHMQRDKTSVVGSIEVGI